jgi:hypothetical protein
MHIRVFEMSAVGQWRTTKIAMEDLSKDKSALEITECLIPPMQASKHSVI